jgi:hypothetical protein
MIRIYTHSMVLLSNDNHMIIRKNHLLKCLEQKKNSFKIFVEELKETYHCDDNKNVTFENLSYSDTKMVLDSLCPNKTKDK